MLVAAVGFGKTIVSAELMRTANAKYGAKSLFLAHLQELVIQTVEKISCVDPGLSCGVFMGRRKDQADITVGTRQTVAKNLEIMEPVNLIIIDECHLFCPQHQAIIDHFLSLNPRLRVLGLTGTPYSLSDGWIYADDDSRRWPDPFFTASIDSMINHGYLSPYRYKVADKMEELEGMTLSRGEFKEADLEEMMVEERHMGSVQHVLDEQCQGRQRIMIFCITIDHAERLAAYLGAHCVHSKLNKDEWRRRVDRFKTGEDRILVNVTQLTVGFDCPEVDCLIVARPTMSASLHVQICGRGLRVAEGKDDVLIIDMVGNYVRHGLPSSPKIRAPREKIEGKEKSDRAASVCPECFEVVEGDMETCTHCGAEMTAKKEIRELEEKVRLEEIERKKELPVIEKVGEKPGAVTKRGFRGSWFWIKLAGGKTLFRFCGDNTKKIEKERARLDSLCPGMEVVLVSTKYGDWIE